MTWRITHRSTRVASDEMVLGWETRLKFTFEQIASVARTVDKFFSERIARAVRTDNNFFKRISQAVRTDDNFFQTDGPNRSNGWQLFSNGWPESFERMTTFFKQIAQVVRTDDNFFWTDTRSRSNGYKIRSKTANRRERFRVRGHAKGLTKYVRYVH